MAKLFSEIEMANRPVRNQKTQVSTKWEAAKEAVVSQVGSLQLSERVTLGLAFNSIAVLAFDGTASQLGAFQKSLVTFPHNGAITAKGDRMNTSYRASSGNCRKLFLPFSRD